MARACANLRPPGHARRGRQNLPDRRTDTPRRGGHGIGPARHRGGPLQRLGRDQPRAAMGNTLNPEVRALLQVKVSHADSAEETFSTLMGDLVEPRRDFIQANALSVANLDVWERTGGLPQRDRDSSDSCRCECQCHPHTLCPDLFRASTFSKPTRQSRSETLVVRIRHLGPVPRHRDCFAALAMTVVSGCHCEERSDEAISMLWPAMGTICLVRTTRPVKPIWSRNPPGLARSGRRAGCAARHDAKRRGSGPE
jgi:hypothetical protein